MAAEMENVAAELAASGRKGYIIPGGGSNPIGATAMVVSHDLLAISRYVKSVACVNKKLHYHNQAEITGDMLKTMYPCTVEEVCPVELVAHGLPHRVLMDHGKRSR